MPSPWLEQFVVDLLKVPNDSSKKKAFPRKARVVQILDCNSENKTLVISDKANTVVAMLTDVCFNSLTENYSASELKNSLVKLDKSKYHMSTVLQNSGNRNVSGVSMPLALHVSSITYMGASGSEVYTKSSDGALPGDINRESTVKGAFVRLGKSYPRLVELLRMNQVSLEEV